MKTKTTELGNWLNDSSVLAKLAKLCRGMAILLGILTVGTLALLLIFIWPTLTQGNTFLLLELLDEMDDFIEVILGMAGCTALFAFGASLLRSKSRRQTNKIDTTSETNLLPSNEQT